MFLSIPQGFQYIYPQRYINNDTEYAFLSANKMDKTDKEGINLFTIVSKGSWLWNSLADEGGIN